MLLEPSVRTADCPLGPDQYRYVATRGWWMGSFGTSAGMLLHLTEQWIRQWVPAHPERDWLLDREVTGRVRWLTGSAREAADEGFDLANAVPTGRYRAAHGDFYAALDHLAPRRKPGTWHTPTTEFLARLPRDPQALLKAGQRQRLRQPDRTTPDYYDVILIAGHGSVLCSLLVLSFQLRACKSHRRRTVLKS